MINITHFVIFINNVHKTCNSISHKRIINHKILNDIELVKIRHLFNNKSLRESRKNKEHENLIFKVSIEHLQRVRRAKGGRIPPPPPGHLVLSHFGTCMCSYLETNLSRTCLVLQTFEFRISRGTSILHLDRSHL